MKNSDIVHNVLSLPKLSALRQEPAQEALRICTARVKELDILENARFVERGMILDAVETNEWWKAGPYTSFDGWLNEISIGRSSAYAAKSTFQGLRDAKISWEEVRAIKRCNIQLVAKLSPQVARKESTLKAAKELSEKEFRAHVAKEHPEQHIEAIEPIKLKFTETQKHNWDLAVSLAKIILDTKSPEEAADAIALEFIQSHQDEEVPQEVAIQ